jgi:hypothetical protein
VTSTLISTLPNPVLAGTGVTAVQVFKVPGASVDATGVVTITPGVLTDPSSITLKVSSANGVSYTWVFGSSGSISKLAVGVYTAEVDTTSMTGPITVEWIGTGACALVAPFTFTVQAPPL